MPDLVSDDELSDVDKDVLTETVHKSTTRSRRWSVRAADFFTMADSVEGTDSTSTSSPDREGRLDHAATVIEDRSQDEEVTVDLVEVHCGEEVSVRGDQGNVLDRIDPEVPSARRVEGEEDVTGWSEIDRLGVWDCALSECVSMEEVPFQFRDMWGRVITTFLRKVLEAENKIDIERALKWFLGAPQFFLRMACKGGAAGR